MGLDGSEEKISAIFDLVKSKMTWDKSNNKYVGEKGIVRAYKEGVGNAAEINLTLVAMLRESGINANPILVSTRSHGIPLFPTKSGFNYVIAGVEMNDEIILLDATEKFSQPSLLPLRDLNWRGRLVRENGSSISVNLYPNTYNMKILKLNASIDAFGALEGTVVTNYHGLNSIYYRNLYQSKNEEDVIEFMQNEHQDIDIEKIRLTNKDNTEKPFTEMFRFSKETGADVIGDKIYISPLLFLSMSENPFKLEERLYPVDFGSPWKNNISISLVIPQGYRIESKPDDIHLTLPNNMGEYLLKTEVQNNKILVQTQTVLNVPIVSPEHYQSLKDLFMKAMAHQQEKVILIQEGT
jgi:hypothetical protein